MSHVTISDYSPRETFTVGAGGSSGPFALPAGFVVFTPSSDIQFFDDGAQLSYVDPPGSSTQFSFSGTLIDGGYQGGSLLLGGKATSGSVMAAVRDIPIERTTDFSYPSSTLDLEGLNTQLDKLFAIFQDRETNQNRALRQPVSDAANIDYIPSATDRAGLYLAFDSDGDPVVSAAPTSTGTAIGSDWNTLLATPATQYDLIIGGATEWERVNPGTPADRQFLGTTGGSPAWGYPFLGLIETVNQTTDRVIVAADRGKIIAMNASAGARTIDADASALGSGFVFGVRPVDLTNAVTIDDTTSTGNFYGYFPNYWAVDTLVIPSGSANLGTVWWFASDGTNWTRMWENRKHTIVQRSYASYTTNAGTTVTIPNDDTIPQSNEGAATAAASITPRHASNRIRVTATWNALASGANGMAVAALFKDAGSTAVHAQSMSLLSGQIGSACFVHEEDAGGTASQTWTLRVGPDLGSLSAVFFNGTSTGRRYGGAMAHTMVIEEIEP